MIALRDDVGCRIPPVVSHSGFIGRFGALSDCMARMLSVAVALLACASVAYGQVIEEGGFPVKGGDVFGESFSLSCSPRLYVAAGEAVSLSCTATSVPEEGVRYAWEAVSGDGLRLLSDAQALAPLFTASLSGAGEEYAYLLTATGAGVYATASVAVTVEGLVQGAERASGAREEECDTFSGFVRDREGCLPWEKAPPQGPFGVPEEEGIVPWPSFPGSPGAEDKEFPGSSDGGPFAQAPPRLECPVAVFMEELETGAIECHAWDASGEEHLEYSWEPVGNTTRDYLENPRLIPEDSPTPSVVAPEAPVYETLESFRSGETTFLYRYRLTATSRATGLSSSSEVEVYVSGSRPSVYCPLEVAVEEGATIALDCEGADPLSHRMDYDEEGASILWEWEGLWGTSVAPLDATDRSSALFTAPAGSAGEEYHYIASMTSQASGMPRTARRRVTVRVRVADQEVASTGAPAPSITCADSEVYEGAADFTLDCSVADEPSDATYSWTGTDVADRLTGTDSVTPTFSAPGEVGGWDKDYDYTVTMTVAGTETASADITVKVLEKPNIDSCVDFRTYAVDEGDSDFELVGCLNDPIGAPEGSEYKYNWTVRGETPLDDLSLLEEIDTSTPVFKVPDDVEENVIYEYLYTISADNADEFTAQYEVIVRNTDQTEFNLVCGTSSVFKVYQGSDDIELNCQALGVPEGAIWEWTARETTLNTDRLSATDIPNPVFDVLDYDINIDVRLFFYYTVSVSKDSKSEKLDVLVKVIDPTSLYEYNCSTRVSFFEGDNNGTIGNCSIKFNGNPIPYDRFNWEWTAREPTSNTDRLSATDIPNPVFDVPDSIDNHEIYEYTVETTRGISHHSHLVSVSVLDRDSFDGVLALTCTEYYYEFYEGSENFEFSCSASGAPDGAEYSYRWNPIGNTENLANLLGARSPNPTFFVPSNVSEDEVYSYRLTVTSTDGNSIPASAVVVVTVKNKPSITVTCPGDPYGAYEGEGDILLDCKATGKPSDSDYVYAWTARGSTVVPGRLSSTTVLKPTFFVPGDIDEPREADKDYEYTVRLSADGIDDITEDVTVTVLEKPDIGCAKYITPFLVEYQVAEGHGLLKIGSCDGLWQGAPEGSAYTYVWAVHGSTPEADLALLNPVDAPQPFFHVPAMVEEHEIYEYRLTVSARNADPAVVDQIINVYDKSYRIDVVCAPPGYVYEGSADIRLECAASGAPAGSEYAYVWTARGSTSSTALLIAGTDGPTPTFSVPDALDATTTYEYLLTVSAENAEDATAEVSVTVLNRGTLAVTCAPPPYVYEGSADIRLECAASGAPAGSEYAYVWTARGSTSSTALLIAGTDGPTPTFSVPDALDATTTYEYLLTVSAENAEDATAEVSVTVLNRGTLAVTCAPPPYVYEGSADIRLECAASGAPAGSEYAYVWTARGSTSSTALLIAGTDGPTPTFSVPDALDATTTYEYLLTVSAENAEDATAEVSVTVLNRGTLAVTCAPPPYVYEGSADIRLECAASGAPAGSEYAYVWTARGSTSSTALLIAGTDGPTPTFSVPDALDATTTYEYLLTVSAENAEDATAEVSVTVLNRGTLAVTCAPPPYVYEGSADIRLECAASGAPAGSEYAYVWTARGSTSSTALLIAGTDGPTPTFSVPDALDATTTYEYLLTVSAENAEDAAAEVSVTVLNRGTLAVTCAPPPYVYEGSADIRLECAASGAPAGSEYAYVWTARGSTSSTALLIAGTDGPTPTFSVPDALDATTTYEYLLTVSAENAEDATAEVSVTVLNRGTLAVTCAPPPYVYEGSADIRLECAASGAPAGSEYAYVWTARGSTSSTALLIAGTDGPTPTFSVPDALDATTTYEYLLTVSAENAEDATAEVSVTVLNRGTLAVTCAPPPYVYEGSADIRLECAASGAPAGSEYAYVWTARGSTSSTALLIAGTDGPTPTFSVPDALDATTTYEYLLTVSAENAEDAAAEVSVTVLNRGTLAVTCAPPPYVYEGSADIRLECAASGAPAGSEYAYVWTARGSTSSTALLIAGTDGPTPTFSVPDALDATTTYEYLLTASAENAEDATAEVTVTVLNLGSIALVCASPPLVYEGSADFALDCAASGAPGGSAYEYEWTARNSTANTSRLSAVNIPSPTFYVPDALDETTTYEYLLTASAENVEDAKAEVSVTVLNKEALAVVCADPGSVYEGSADIAFDCSASGAPGDDPQYTYVWTARGDTPDTSLLSAVDVSSPTFDVPDEVDEDETYEYTLTVSAVNAEDAAAEVTVTVLDRIQTPAPDPVSPPVDSPSPVASSSAREPSDPSALGVTVSASSLRFGVQSSQTEVSLDPLTDGISTRVSGPYHAGRMALSPGGGASFDENGEMDLSIEVISPVLLKREDAAEPSSLVLSPSWSFAESCEQLSSQAIGGLYTEATLTEGACRLLRFGGELDLTGAPSGRYAGSLDVVLRSGEREETHSVEVEVTVVPSQRVITIGPGGVRFSTSRELAAGLTEEQNLSIYPDVAFLTEGKPHGVFELSNPSLVPLEVSVSARFGYTEATRDGREVVVEDASGSHLGDLSQVVDIHPAVVVLQPGEKGLVRYGVKEGALSDMDERGCAAFFDVVSSPRQYVRSDRMPEEVTGERTARVTMRVPGVYVPDGEASQLRATLLSISYVGSVSATFLLETQDRPFAGEVVAYDGQGRELGRRETLVYTRSRVRVPLARMPEEEVVFLRFAPWGSSRVPEPTSVEWNAPRRDIGAAQDKAQTPTSAAIAEKP